MTNQTYIAINGPTAIETRFSIELAKLLKPK